MTFRDLQIFVAVCDKCNITAAAKELRISQPSVSQVITNIENEYDVCLFERFSKKLYITESGKLLLDYARHILFSLNEMEDRLKGSGIIHKLKIGASVTIGACILSTITKKFSLMNPNIEIQAVIDNTRIIENFIIKNSLDLGLVEGKVYDPNIVTIPFIDDELVLVCGKSHSLYGKKIIDKDVLSSLNFIVREEGSGTRELFDSVMNSVGIQWLPYWVCNNFEGIKNAVIEGIGVTVISRMLIEKEVRDKQLHIIKIQNVYFKRKFNIIYHNNKYMSEPLRNFIDMCLL